MSVVVCPVCREVVHLASGYIVRHGSRNHGVLSICSGSGTPYVTCNSCAL